MTYLDVPADDRQPICPACGITMHPLLDEGEAADECRECGFRVEWSSPRRGHRRDDDERPRSRWDDED
ncbi:zf-TFIIB domain-containing protein [Microbacterium sp. NPDC090007]|uniref:zf-TFIIB domain-containing protein n=1 Tax=Microbacterium sp. NPDC090007 TaxID=3364204 RepID=UPI00381E5F7C